MTYRYLALQVTYTDTASTRTSSTHRDLSASTSAAQHAHATPYALLAASPQLAHERATRAPLTTTSAQHTTITCSNPKGGLRTDGGTSARQPSPHAAGNYSEATADALATLEDTLDAMHDTGEPFLDGFVLNSSVDRCEGGQGLVQFCKRLHRPDEFAIKCARCPAAVLTAANHARMSAPCISLVLALFTLRSFTGTWLRRGGTVCARY